MTTATQATHTPGPWRVADSRAYGLTGECLREIRGPKYKDNSSVLIAEMSDINERDDNARLIASAPELLDALQDLAQIAREYVAEGIPRLDAAIEKAAFVALKARGEVL